MDVAILGMGASLQPEDVDYLRGRCRVMCINETFRLALWADWLYACDYQWWGHYIDEVRAVFAGSRWTQVQSAPESVAKREREQADREDVGWVRSMPGAGFSITPGLIYTGGSSGIQAMQLAAQFGAERIVLLGFDGRPGTWMQDRPDRFRKASPFPKWLTNMDVVAAQATVPIINATPGSEYRMFPMADLRDVL